MPVITGFEPQGRRKQEILILLDGAPWETLDAETAVKQGLRQGMAFDRNGLDRLLETDRAVRARKCAAGLLARGPKTRRELEGSLKRRGYAPAAIAAALEVLAASGTFDESRSADAVIARRRRGGFGPKRIEAELIRRGIPAGQAARQVAVKLAEADLPGECDALARRAAPKYAPLTDPARRRKLAAFLLRRGYAPEMVRKSLAKLGADADDAED